MLSFVGFAATAQQRIITRYFDSSWRSTSKDSAFFYTEMVDEGSVYNYTTYWMRSKKLNYLASYTDTNFAKPVGLLRRYYESGGLEDSSFHYESGQLKNTWHYYPNGKLYVHYTYDLTNKKTKTEGYDEAGKIIDDFVFMKEASFGEPKAWQNYLAENIRQNTPVDKGAAKGTYQVIVRFIVGADGKVLVAEAETNYGFGMEEEVIRVIKKSPKWQPAIYLGKAVNAYRRQPITFVVKDKSKKNKD